MPVEDVPQIPMPVSSALSAATAIRHLATRARRHTGRRRAGGLGMTSGALITGEASRPHVPVLLAEVVEALDLRPDALVIDGTFGAGGYSRAILDTGAQVIAIDRDPTAIAAGQALVAEAAGRLALVHDRFANLDAVADSLGHTGVDGVVLDIGVSSMQLDQAERGFSFRFDGPLDMRMALDGESAADLVASLDETDLANLIYRYGEERLSRHIAKAVVRERAIEPIVTTRRLADIVGRVVRSKPGDIHPATRTFQALRIAVNDELGELEQALEAAERILKPGGRLVVVTFHSLEDRIVKQFLVERSATRSGGSRHQPAAAMPDPTFVLVHRKAVTAGPAESADNPRARSAKLRAGIRTEAQARSVRP
jgi:16S rRNA (cytosine1402-N4)-methyltransferase